MKAIIKRELKNYLKNPILWIGLAFILFELFQILNPYLQIRYVQSEQDTAGKEPENIADADITEGYVLSTEEQRMDLACGLLQEEMQERLSMTKEEAGEIVEEMRRQNLDAEEMADYLSENYGFYPYYGPKYYYEISEFHKGTVEEVNAYLRENLEEHTYSFYLGRKFADFGGLFLAFFAMILLAFLFIRDTKRDTWELLHTKPVGDAAYICGKILGGFLSMVFLWGILTLLFGGLCELQGRRCGFPVNFGEFVWIAAIYILPTMLMITCVYTAVALIFKNPLPGVPCLFLYLIYSNMGSRGPDGSFGYYGRPLAIMVRFPGRFFETTPPPLVLLNQSFLVIASVCITFCAVWIWKRRRVY